MIGIQHCPMGGLKHGLFKKLPEGEAGQVGF